MSVSALKGHFKWSQVYSVYFKRPQVYLVYFIMRMKRQIHLVVLNLLKLSSILSRRILPGRWLKKSPLSLIGYHIACHHYNLSEINPDNSLACATFVENIKYSIQSKHQIPRTLQCWLLLFCSKFMQIFDTISRPQQSTCKQNWQISLLLTDF